MLRQSKLTRRQRAQGALQAILLEMPSFEQDQIRQFETIAYLLAQRYQGAELVLQLRKILMQYREDLSLNEDSFYDTSWMSSPIRTRFQAEMRRIMEMPQAESDDYLRMNESWKGPLGLFFETPENLKAFALLGIDPPSTPDQIRQAYRQKARSLHPDLGGEMEAFIHLQRAYRMALESCI
jgi:DnaJ-domain-containing protein 1